MCLFVYQSNVDRVHTRSRLLSKQHIDLFQRQVSRIGQEEIEKDSMTNSKDHSRDIKFPADVRERNWCHLRPQQVYEVVT